MGLLKWDIISGSVILQLLAFSRVLLSQFYLVTLEVWVSLALVSLLFSYSKKYLTFLNSCAVFVGAAYNPPPH